MPTRYRLLDAVDMQALHGMKVQIEVSENYVVLIPLKAGAGFTIIAQAIKARGAKENGHPTDDGLPDAVTLTARESLDA